MLGFYNYTVILTYLSVASALTGVLFCTQQNVHAAVVCLMISGLCDLFDGSVARTKKRTEQEKRFGIQIDSLADLICFGVLPAAIGFTLGLRAWYFVLPLALYTLAALIRLAYYNVTEEELQFSEKKRRLCYEGLPVTTASLLVPLLFAFEPLLGAAFPYVYALWLLLIAAAFVCRFKIAKFDMKRMIIAAIVGALVLAALILEWTL